MSSAFLNEDAYFKVLKSFASGKYDLKKEMLLAKLRRELLIPDQRHEKMREMIQHGVELRERDFDKAAQPRGIKREHQPTKRQRDDDSSENEDFVKAGSTKLPPISPFSSQPKPHSKRPSPYEGAVPAKRQKRESSGGTFAVGQVAAEINELIGYKVRRYWPENGGWFDGAITDYNAVKGEHCITYDMNKPTESYEWYDVNNADEEEFQLMNEKINIIEHAPQGGQPSMQAAPQRGTDHGGGGERGLPNGQGRGSGDQRMSAGYGNHGYQNHQPPSTAHRLPSAQGGQGVAFIAESDDSSSSDDSFSE